MRSGRTAGERRRRHVGALLVAVFGIAAGLTLPTHPATAAPGAGRNPRAPFLGIMPSAGGASANPAAAAPHLVTPVTYHGGPVQHSSSVYAIFWTPAATTLPSGYQATVNRYFTDVMHDSYKPSNDYSVATQYYDGTGTAKQPVFYWVPSNTAIGDTRAFPANGCPNYVLDDGTTSTHCFTNLQIVNEIKATINARHLPTGLGTNYFLFTPRGVASCFAANSLSTGGCYNPMQTSGFCAYHSYFALASASVLFANMPYAAVTGCASGQAPEGNAADSVLNSVAHEHMESITDPLGTAWYDVDGNEIADKCYTTFGTPLGTNAFGSFNQVINTHDYWLQEIWSNRTQACAQRNAFAQPVASFTYAPAAPVHGQPVAFQSTSHNPDGTALKFRWTATSGAVSAVANPTFTFATAGVKIVTLVVWDAQGDQARVQRSITVS
jgi:hypothetical protein